MDKKITEKEAYDLYLKYGYEDVVPFKSVRETDFLDWLKGMGWEIKKEEDD